MLLAGRFEVLATIHESDHSTIFHARETASGEAVAIKWVPGPPPHPQDLARLVDEYARLAACGSPYIIRIHEILPMAVAETSGLALVGEYFSSLCLRDRLREGPVPLAEFFLIAIQVTRALAAIHERGIIHRDIKPANILYNPEGGLVKLADFGTSLFLAPASMGRRDAPVGGGTPAYLSPEQTGRTGRGLDTRTDLYSFGVTCYELLVGRLPFPETETAALIHAHLAKPPPAAAAAVPGLPAAVSALIEMLMQKDPDRRYQHAEGLLEDLLFLQRDPGADHAALGFVPGAVERRRRLQLPEYPYGREAEREAIAGEMERAATGEARFLSLCGPAGSGKSRLGQEVLTEAAAAGWQTAYGACPEVRPADSLACLREAVGSLLRGLLVLPEAEFAVWKNRLAAALGLVGQAVLAAIPELSFFIGTDAVVESGEADGDALAPALRIMLAEFSRIESPLLLVLDNLHWADAATFRQVRVLLEMPGKNHMLVLGLCRSLAGECAILSERFPGRARHLQLRPLDVASISRFLRDALVLDATTAEAAAVAVCSRTGGSPFYIKEFMSLLSRQGLVRHDGGNWVFDMERIWSLPAYGDDASFLLERLARQPPAVRDALETAALLGSRFPRAALEACCRGGAGSVAVCLGEGFFIHAGERDLSFASTAFEAEAKALLDGPARHARQALIAGRLLDREPGELETAILLPAAKAVMDAGPAAFPDTDPRPGTALVLAAAHCLALADYRLAADFFRAAVSFPVPGGGSGRSRLILDWAEAALGAGDLQEAREACDGVFGKTGSTAERGRAWRIRIRVQQQQFRPVEAIETGLAAIKEYDIEFPGTVAALEAVDAASLRQELEALLGAGIARLEKLPASTHPGFSEALAIINEIFVPVRVAVERMECIPFLAARVLNLVIRHGFDPAAALGGAFLAAFFSADPQRRREGFHLADLAMAWRSTADVAFLVRYGVDHYRRPLRETLADAEADFSAALAHGSGQWVPHHADHFCMRHLFAGIDLEHVATVYAVTALRRRTGAHDEAELFFNPPRQFVACLRQGNPERVALDGEFFRETEEARLHEGRYFAGPAVISLFRLMLLCQAGRFSEALEVAERGVVFLSAGFGQIQVEIFPFYHALAWFASEKDEMPIPEHVAGALDRLHGLGEAVPQNFAAMAMLLEALVAGRERTGLAAVPLFEEAMRLAAETGHPEVEGLAAEQAGAFWRRRGYHQYAAACLRRARRAAEVWQAPARLAWLQRNWPEYLPRAEVRFTQEDDATTSSSSSAVSSGSGIPTRLALDLLVRSASAIFTLSDVDDLLGRLLALAVEYSGAGRGALFLEQHGIPTIRAVRGEEGAWPMQAVNHCYRTGERLTLGATIARRRFPGEPCFFEAPASLLCIGLNRQQHSLGVLCLENRHLPDAFPPSVQEILQLLVSLATTAIENARLYQDLSGSEERFRLAMEATSDGLWDWDIVTNRVYFSPRWYTMLGYADRELPMEFATWERLLHPDDRGRAREYVLAFLGQDKESFQIEFRMVARDGGSRWILARGDVVRRDHDGRPERLLGTHLDITDRMLAAERIESSLRDKEVLLREVHHRVKNNFQVISSLLNIQAEKSGDRNTRAALEESRQRVRSMALIHEKLYKTDDLAAVDFIDYAESLAGQLIANRPDSGTRVRLEIAGDRFRLPLDLAVPGGLLLNELIVNSLKHAFAGRPAGVIRIAFGEDADGLCRIEYGDDGTGFPAGLDWRNTETLGLQLLHLLTEQIGGTVSYRGEGGTVFTIRFPVALPAR